MPETCTEEACFAASLTAVPTFEAASTAGAADDEAAAGAADGVPLVGEPAQAVQRTAMAPAAASAPGRRRIMCGNPFVKAQVLPRDPIEYRP